jgi:hypothetical protein
MARAMSSPALANRRAAPLYETLRRQRATKPSAPLIADVSTLISCDRVTQGRYEVLNRCKRIEMAKAARSGSGSTLSESSRAPWACDKDASDDNKSVSRI